MRRTHGLSGGEVERLKPFQVAGIKHMPVAFTPAKAAAP